MEPEKKLELVARPQPDLLGPEMTALAGKAPAVMGELMGQFIERKSLTSRATIRLRMKALLDLFSADTGYPPIPSLAGRPEGMGAYAQQAGMGYVPAPMANPALGMGRRVAGEAEQLQQEVERALHEEEAAAAPADVAPVPGAEVAPVAPLAE